MLILKNELMEKLVSSADRKGGFDCKKIESLGVIVAVANTAKYPNIPIPGRFSKEIKKVLGDQEYRFFLPEDVSLLD